MLRFKRIWSVITTVFVVLAVLLAILLVGVRVAGLQPYVVLSGSMEPTYPVGSMIYTKKVDPSELQKNDPLTFHLNSGAVATHRIVEVIQPTKAGETLSFRTKGDANAIADADPIPADRILGKPVFCVPLLGFVANFIQRPPGLYVVVGIGILVITLSFVTDWIPLRKQETTENNDDDIQEEEL